MTDKKALLNEVAGNLQASADLIEDYLVEHQGAGEVELPSFMFSAARETVSLIPVQDEAFLPVLAHVLRASDKLIQKRLSSPLRSTDSWARRDQNYPNIDFP